MSGLKVFVALLMVGACCGLVILPTAAKDKKEGNADHEFAKKASACGMAEVDLSNLAVRFSSNAAVREFAEKMVADHAKAGRELTALANREQIKLPATKDEKHEKLWKKLSKMTGSEFDCEYMKCMVKDHEEAVKCFEKQSKNGQDEALKKWAGKKLPTLKEHLKLAREVEKKVKEASK